MPCLGHLVVALALVLTLSHALPAEEVPEAQKEVSSGHEGGRLQKRAASPSIDTNQEELAALKDLIFSRLAAQLDDTYQDLSSFKRDLLKAEVDGEEDEEENEGRREEGKKKRMFAPLSGLPGNLRTIKRQIRYHQCYFNPISCFRRK
uniref:C-type allatostatin n=1 Tax=Callinectes arcuatus TaxID=257891 RepID=A0A7T1L7F2_CALAT|nr:C-type allatostatin [Callinectes arcuatus]